MIAFSASLRTHEIAIRMALGAQRNGIATLVLVSGAKLALIGCSLGVLVSLGVSRIIQSLLFEVSATDPIIYVAGALIMMITALLASALPATRAASVDPIVSLRLIRRSRNNTLRGPPASYCAREKMECESDISLPVDSL